MSGKTALFIFTLVFLLLPAFCSALDSPVMISHSVERFSTGEGMAMLSFEITIENTADSELGGLSLELVSAGIIPLDDATVLIGDVGPGSTVQTGFDIELPLALATDELASLPLFWKVRYTDVSGTSFEFPAESHAVYEGGGQ